jgi:hypothetical protein
MSLLLTSPNSASRLYSINSKNAPRQRHAFAVRFMSPIYTDASKVTYVVKTADRPSVQPTVEELNQYNKHRLIHTGYKIPPVKIVFYDTWQGHALRMWHAYMQHYFGDFARAQPGSNYHYDQTSPVFQNSNNLGFGFTARNGGGEERNQSQFFFEYIKIAHFYDSVFDDWTLVNPRFSSFDPDELDYAESQASMINAQVNCEAMLYRSAVPTAGDEWASGLFNEGFKVPDNPDLVPPTSPDAIPYPQTQTLEGSVGAATGNSATAATQQQTASSGITVFQQVQRPFNNTIRI